MHTPNTAFCCSPAGSEKRHCILVTLSSIGMVWYSRI